MNKILLKDTKFKSLMVSINYLLPLKEKEASKNALIALVLKQGCDKYRSEKEIEMQLASLYNASVDTSIEKLGDNYSITFNLDILNKKYISKDVLSEALNILKNIIYFPYLERGVFCKEYIDREKEALISRINEMKNNKKKYSINRLEQEMFRGEAYSVSRFGKIEDIEKETPESVYNQYTKLINTGKVTIIVSGNTDGYEDILSLVTDTLEINLDKSEDKYVYTNQENEQGALKNIEEYEDLSQSILCLGLKFKNISKSDTYAIGLYNTILGETPASKLFQNVREKESLAYFAAAQYIKFKGAIYIYTGIGISNLDKAKKVIKDQIEDIKNGNISDEELEAAKRHSLSKIKLMKDSKEGMLMYTISNTAFNEGKVVSLEEIEQEISKLSKEQVVDIANKAYIDTIYLLGGKINE